MIENENTALCFITSVQHTMPGLLLTSSSEGLHDGSHDWHLHGLVVRFNDRPIKGHLRAGLHIRHFFHVDVLVHQDIGFSLLVDQRRRHRLKGLHQLGESDGGLFEGAHGYLINGQAVEHLGHSLAAGEILQSGLACYKDGQDKR